MREKEWKKKERKKERKKDLDNVYSLSSTDNSTFINAKPMISKNRTVEILSLNITG